MNIELALVKTNRPCPFSGSRQAHVVCHKDRHGNALRNVISLKSGLIFVDPVPFENTEEFYKEEYRKSYKGTHTPKLKHIYRAGLNALIRFNKITSLISLEGPVLDAGSSSGEFLYLLNKKNIDAVGIEANRGYAKFSISELGVQVQVEPFSAFTSKENFSAITMFHVLEHLENPVLDLKHLTKNLKPGGYLIIEVPNILYPDMSFNNKWHSGHLFSYCERTLRLLAEKISMEVVFCEPIMGGGNLFSIFQKVGHSEKQNDSFFVNATKKIKLLNCQKKQYFRNPRNYLKFFIKIKRFIVEKNKSQKKSAREILDSIYVS